MRCVCLLFNAILLFIPLFVHAASEHTCAEGRVGWPRVVNKYGSRTMFLTLHRVLNKERLLPCLDISCRLFGTYYSLFSATILVSWEILSNIPVDHNNTHTQKLDGSLHRFVCIYYFITFAFSLLKWLCNDIVFVWEFEWPHRHIFPSIVGREGSLALCCLAVLPCRVCIWTLFHVKQSIDIMDSGFSI